MLNEEICKVRKMLNESIITGKNYKEIYELSVKLDKLIAQYYIDNEK
ncbi:MAG: aspartyl-phosphate phosphatase Spo0E family protein [Clostridiales bacterium]|nr:aspartyl-phosphate phosphatase Spo0E family protein [Clostridiales bacterium]